MILLIDGYNLIKQVILKKTVSDDERAHFIKQLGKYAKLKGHKIIIVFDGGAYDRPTKDKEQGVYVVYAGAQATADDYIKNYLKDHRFADILLISTDLELCRFALKLNIEHMYAKEFYYIMQDSLKKGVKQKPLRKTKAIKTSDVQNEALDEIMQEASKVVEYKSEDFVDPGYRDLRESSPQKLSKKERKKRKKIKKL